MKAKFLFSVAVLSTASCCFAQGAIDKLIGDRLKQIKEANRDIAEKSGDYSLSVPEKKHEAKPTGKADGKTSVEVDIKGIKIGMSQSEVAGLIGKSLAKSEKCQISKLSPNDDMYLYGDAIIRCNEAFVYFGDKVSTALFIFFANKLKVVSLSSFSSENSNADPLPRLARSLGEGKFKVEPAVTLEPGRMSGMGQMSAIWTDPTGTSLIMFGRYQKDSTGYVHRDHTIEVRPSDYAEYIEERHNALVKQEETRQRQNTARKNADL